MQKFWLIVLGAVLSWVSNAAAELDCSKLPTCADLNYTQSASDCNGLYFTCPFDKTKVKCDETATVGDIKYSKSLTPGEGWLYCNGDTYDKAKYPELYSLIGAKFGGTATAPKLPDYRGVYLRGAGKVEIIREDSISTVGITEIMKTSPQPSSIIKHKHDYPFYYLSSSVAKNGGYATQHDFWATAGAIVTFLSSGSTETCPASIGLYPYIYAGVVK